MRSISFNSKLLRGFTALVVLLFMTLMFATNCFAVPANNPASNEDLGWVDLNATVPEGFSGTVSVSFQHNETGEIYTITCFDGAEYQHSIQVPYGEYTVDRTYTSEDSFVYEAFIDLDTFEVNGNRAMALDVNVTCNEAALEFLNSPDAAVPEKVEKPEEPVAEPDASSSEEPEPTQEPSEPSVDSSADTSVSEPTEPTEVEEEAEDSPILSVIKRIGMALMGTAVFIMLVLLAALFVRRRYYGE